MEIEAFLFLLPACLFCTFLVAFVGAIRSFSLQRIIYPIQKASPEPQWTACHRYSNQWSSFLKRMCLGVQAKLQPNQLTSTIKVTWGFAPQLYRTAN